MHSACWSLKQRQVDFALLCMRQRGTCSATGECVPCRPAVSTPSKRINQHPSSNEGHLQRLWSQRPRQHGVMCARLRSSQHARCEDCMGSGGTATARKRTAGVLNQPGSADARMSTCGRGTNARSVGRHMSSTDTDVAHLPQEVSTPVVEHSPIMCMMRDATATTLRICKGVRGCTPHTHTSKACCTGAAHVRTVGGLARRSHCSVMTHRC